MKKTFAVAAMLLTMAGAASAQGGGGGGGGGGMGRGGTPEQRDSTTLSRLFNGITLNADQTSKAKAIITKAREALASLDRQAPDYRDKMTAANNSRNTDLKELLTSDADKTKFDANAAMGGRGRGGH